MGWEIARGSPLAFRAESAAGCQPRATPWVTDAINRCALKGRRDPPPLQGGRFHAGTLPGVLPRAGILRAFGAGAESIPQEI
jgi:hypothetical protein